MFTLLESLLPMQTKLNQEDERATNDLYNQFLDFDATDPPWSGTHVSSESEF